MKKVLTTVAGLVTFAFMGTACAPAVDTKEDTSTTPIAVSTVASQRVDDIRKEVQEFKKSRGTVRPKATPKPAASLHELHVQHVAIVKARTKANVTKQVVEAKVTKTVEHKVKKTVKAKKAVKKTKKTLSKIKKVSLAGIAACIAKYESGGNPRAQNPHSSASGLFQFVDGTWNNFKGYARAMYAPVSVQLEKFYIVWNGGRGAGNWVVAPKCGY